MDEPFFLARIREIFLIELCYLILYVLLIQHINSTMRFECNAKREVRITSRIENSI